MPLSDACDPDSSIAVIGMDCRFPGANDTTAFWRNLRDGVESVTFFSDEELLGEGIDAATLQAPNYVKAHAVIDDIDLFDADFFGYSPKEAMLIDPQHRLFLETCWRALEDAGYSPRDYDGAVGVFAGTRMSTYYVNYLSHDLREYGTALFLRSHIGCDRDHLCTRTSYKLNLRGPSFNLQCACSTSLVAVHLACESLLSGQCDMALAGAAGVDTPQKHGYFYQEGMIFSPDGHCRPFDAKAGGIVSGNGVGVVTLKRLSDALRDKDDVHAVIRGSAVNNDGEDKAAYAAPGLEGQREVIAEALAVAGVNPETVSFVEAHGTGTHLGDPLEVEALTRAFSASTSRRGFCALGSVKSNIGHLEVAAGAASLIKAVLSLKHGEIPPTAHFKEPNPRIDFQQTPFFVNNTRIDWPDPRRPRRACVSSFGVGGTNAHVVLEEAPPRESAAPSDKAAAEPLLLTLSARQKPALAELAKRYAAFFRANPDLDPADCCFTSRLGRAHHEHRLALVADDADELLEQLEEAVDALPKRHDPPKAETAFLFTGQGAQHPGMGKGLYEADPVFRRELDRCAAILAPLLPRPLLSVMWDEASEDIHNTLYTQPALFSLEYALAEMWGRWGIDPAMLLGHSVGEYAAAARAGVFSLEDGLTLIAARGRLIAGLPAGGAMAALRAGESVVRELLNEAGEGVDIAAINSPDQTVVSGDAEAVDRAAELCRTRDIAVHPLPVSHAFHSHRMDPVLEAFGEVAAKISYAPPNRPVVSNITGEAADPERIAGPQYWVDHIRRPVRFADSMAAVGAAGCNFLLEIGPHPVLTAMGRQTLDAPDIRTAPSLSRGRPDRRQVLESLAQAYVGRAPADWRAFQGERPGRRVHLPTYPFQGRRCWVDDGTRSRLDVEAGPAPFSREAVWKDVIAGTAEWSKTTPDRPDEAAYAARERQMGALCAAYAAEALKRLNAFSDPQASRTAEELCAELSIPPHYAQLFRRLLDGLAAEGLLTIRDGRFSALKSGDKDLPAAIDAILESEDGTVKDDAPRTAGGDR